MKTRFPAALGTVLLLAACGSTPATRYYQLPDSAFRLPEKTGGTTGIKVVLSDALQSRSLLYQTDAHTLSFAQKNLWAEPLSNALERALANKLNAQGSLKYQPAQAGEAALTVYLDRFQGTYRGETEISGYARWKNGAEIPVRATTPQQGDGYPAMLESLNGGLDSIARQIAR